MTQNMLTRQSEQGDENEINLLLEEQDAYICRLARQKLHYDARVEDLVQLSRIKFWQAAKARRILNPRSYIRCIVKTTYVEMMRQQRSDVSLPMSEDGELLQGHLLCMFDEELYDPQDIVERREWFRNILTVLANAAAALPPRQRKAMICRLKDRFDDLPLLSEIFHEKNLNIEDHQWPTDVADRRNLSASVAPASRKLKKLMRER